MATAPPRARPAHAPGPTYLTYTPNGRKLITVGSNDLLRVFETGSDGEPITIEDARDSNFAVAATDTFFVTGSEDGSVCKFSLETNTLDQVLVRCTMPIRDLALSPNGQWLAVASDDVVIKIVDTENMDRVLQIRDLPKPAKHVSFDPSGTILTASCTDGVVYFYSMKEEQPSFVRQIDGLIRATESDDGASAKAEWHPDGRAFAVPTSTRDIQIVSHRDWANQRVFSSHATDITALSWSPNGSLLASASKDGFIYVWDTKTQKTVHQLKTANTVLAFSWHPIQNILSYTNNEGELYIHEGFVGPDHAPLLQKELQPAPFIHDPLGEISGNAQRRPHDDTQKHFATRPAREGTPDSLDDLRDFIEDDENAHPEYVTGSKRGASDTLQLASKRLRGSSSYPSFAPDVHAPFQPGATPWMGDRKYLTSNLLGLIWTVDHNTSADAISAPPHRTVTVEFYDRSFQRDFHFTDLAGYDLASLSEKGALFASRSRGEGKGDDSAEIYYRPHEHWTTSRPDWRAKLPDGEEPLALALSESFVAVATDRSYVRLYTHGGSPVRVWRPKSAPVVAMSAFRDYLFVCANGAATANASCELRYSIHALKRDDLLQNNDLVPLPPEPKTASVDDPAPGVANVFFSDAGDPCLYDSTGVLLVLSRWRDAGRATWVPLLDTNLLERKQGGRRDERYWPVGVAEHKFYCFILKGFDLHPAIYPRPLLTDFPFAVPIATSFSASSSAADAAARSYEETWARTAVLHALQADLVDNTAATKEQAAELARFELEMDVLVLKLLGQICAGRREEDGAKALALVELMRDRRGDLLQKAGLIAGRFGLEVLAEKIAEVAERRVVGLVGEE